jgi:hypothetical protein
MSGERTSFSESKRSTLKEAGVSFQRAAECEKPAEYFLRKEIDDNVSGSRRYRRPRTVGAVSWSLVGDHQLRKKMQ